MEQFIPDIKRNCDLCLETIRGAVEKVEALDKNSDLSVACREVIEKSKSIDFKKLQEDRPEDQEISQEIMEFWGKLVWCIEKLADIKKAIVSKETSFSHSVIEEDVQGIIDAMFLSNGVISVSMGPDAKLSSFIKAFNSFMEQNNRSDRAYKHLLKSGAFDRFDDD